MSLFLFHRYVDLYHILDSTQLIYGLISYGNYLYLSDLLLLSMIISRSIHVAADGIILFFQWLSNIHCMCMCIHTHTHTPHLLSHSSVSGQLGCLHVLVIVHSAAMNIGVHVSF